MTERIVNFADMAFKLRGRRSLFEKDRCEHIRLELDENGGIVTCMDCKKEISAFWALQHMAERWERHALESKNARQRINDDAKKIIHLRAAKRIEQVWRRGMACCCPHCHKPILAEDGMGGVTESRERVLERRKFERNAVSAGGATNGPAEHS